MTILLICIYRVFVNGRNRSTIVDDIQTRIRRRNISLERREAIKVSLLT